MSTAATTPATPPPAAYPVHVDADLDPGLSRWLWLVKWVLAIPHYVVLAFLWVAFVVTSVVALVGILATGRYPRAVFDFNVGVLRWSWRVAYYAYGALGTDRYPPFTLHDVPDYPAHLEVDYPERLSRGLALVKWWLLAIPHYLVVGLFLGGAGYAVEGANEEPVAGFSLIGLLVLVAGVTLLFTGRYPGPLYDFVLGLNRWVLRVAGYVSLMTDRYPPFSLEQGGHEHPVRTGPEPAPTTAAPTSSPVSGAAVPGHRTGWTTGRVVSLVVGSLLLMGAVGLGTGAGALVVADQTARNDAGFLMSPTETLQSPTFAIASGDWEIHTDAPNDSLPKSLLGDATLVASSDQPVFVGVAPAEDVAAYLAGVEHDTLTDLRDGDATYDSTAGGAPTALPAEQSFWTAQDTGTDATLTWPVEEGDWTAVVMNADGSAGVSADLAAGAEVPVLSTVIAVLLVLTGLLLAAGVLLVAIPLRAATRTGGRTGGATTTSTP